MGDERPLVIVRPTPVRRERIVTPAAWRQLCETYRVVDLEEDDSDEAFAAALPEAFAVVGQPALDAAALERAEQLRCVLNVEGAFFPNLDHAAAHHHGVAVLGCGPAYAQAVAEYSPGLALDLCRGITRADRDFRAGTERTRQMAASTPTLRLRVSDVWVKGLPHDTTIVVRWDTTQDMPAGSAYVNHGVHVIKMRWLKVVSIDANEDSQAVERGLAVFAAHGVAEATAAPITS